jgi:hypothetical protein
MGRIIKYTSVINIWNIICLTLIWFCLCHQEIYIPFLVLLVLLLLSCAYILTDIIVLTIFTWLVCSVLYP